VDVHLPNLSISRRHFEVGRDECGAWVRDLDSRNGTWVNGTRIQGREAVHRLRLDDAIWLCEASVRLGATVPVHPAWLDWNHGTVRKIAHAIDEDGSYDHLPILADALEEAGCTDQAILDHCRGPGAHHRGCCVVELLLNKEWSPFDQTSPDFWSWHGALESRVGILSTLLPAAERAGEDAKGEAGSGKRHDTQNDPPAVLLSELERRFKFGNKFLHGLPPRATPEV
jgi:hypothetical protein